MKVDEKMQGLQSFIQMKMIKKNSRENETSVNGVG